MERRFEVRKKEMLAGCKLDPDELEGARDRLRKCAAPFTESLYRTEQKEHAREYVEGLVSDLETKNAELIAYLHGMGRKTMQHFLGESAWDHEPLLDELAREVAATIGEPDGVIVFDPSAHRKSGRDSVGVQRQWCGRLGKRDNCQVGIYMGYTSREEHALVDERLFLPEEWVKARPEKAWTRIEVQAGERGPITVECMKRRVRARTEDRRVGPEELLFVTRSSSWRHGSSCWRPVGGKKATPEITLQQARAWIASELREALGRRAVREIEQRLQRKALARFYHWKERNLLAPLRGAG